MRYECFKEVSLMTPKPVHVTALTISVFAGGTVKFLFKETEGS